VGLTKVSGPHVRLIQLLPSSTVAAGLRLKIGLGTVASEMPGGTLKLPLANSGGVRDPLQYCMARFGLAFRIFVPVPFSAGFVSTE
jgi:hypothetical protein